MMTGKGIIKGYCNLNGIDTIHHTGCHLMVILLQVLKVLFTKDLKFHIPEI